MNNFNHLNLNVMNLSNKFMQQLKLMCVFLLLSTVTKAQEPTLVVDSSLLDRINTIEQEASYIKPEDSHLMIVVLLTFVYESNKPTVTYNGASVFSKSSSVCDAYHFEFSPMLLWSHG